ncbi:MAG: glycosyltransferase family 1 protein [Patescibacteria group bacterium]
MRIGIDARALTQHPTSGVAMFTREIIDALRCVSDDELILFTKTDIARPFRRLPIIGNHFAFARAVDKAKVDVFFSPTGLLPLGLKTPSVAFVHDLIILKHPEWFPDSIWQRFFTLRFTMPSTIRRARRVLVPSMIVRDDLVQFFPEAGDKVEVVPEGVRRPEVIQPLSDEQRQCWGVVGQYLLSVGTLEPRKNHEAACFTLETIVVMMKLDVQLLLIGSRGWGAGAILQKIDEVNRRLGRQAVCYLGAVSEEEKWTLYQNAEMLLAVSRDEGFYLPPFEALAVGTPVIATAVGAVPDLLTDAVTIVQPNDVEGIVQAVESVLRQKPEVTASQLTWEQAARRILDVFSRF